SSPANNPRQSIALEVLFQLAANTKVDRQAVLTFNLLSNDISVLAVSIMTIATLHLYFLGNSPYLSFDLKGFFSKLAKKQTNGTIVSKEFFLDEVAKTSESMIDKDL
ncbi:MAG: hypothetical protein JO235_20485, partial [Chroococcidiopsidaceae cyanobacterium CP_BM_RX_35]|nr:hypothetical protein [Chroococcidiopsidaceae cyanobacterium CP_BM_RX_35]